MTPPHLTRAHEQADVEYDLFRALEIVDTLGPPDDLRVAVFQSAAAALLLRVADPRPQPIPDDVLERLRSSG